MSDNTIGGEAVQGDNATTVTRGTTGKRILCTLLFLVVAAFLIAALGLLVLFELGYALITERRPHPRVPRLARRIMRYGLEIAQYITWNTERLPFPFEELPNGADPVGVNLAAH